MPADSGPVFIGGLDQSGKTPLRRMLEAATDIAFSRRLYLWTHFYGRYGDLADATRRARCLTELRRYRRVAQTGIDFDDLERAFAAGPLTYPRLFGLIGAQAAAVAGRARWGEQEGGVEERLAEILDAFPDARVVHMVRDPRERHLAATAGRRRPGQLGISIHHWRADARRALDNARAHPASYLVVRFEDLARDPARESERVARFVGRTDPARLLAAAAAWAGDPGPGYDASIGHRAAAISAGELAFVDSRLAPELAELHYRVRPPALSARHRLRYATVTWPLNTASPLVARAVSGLRRLGGGRATAKVRLDEVPA